MHGIVFLMKRRPPRSTRLPYTTLFRSSHGTSAGFRGAQTATKVLSLTAIDLLTDKKLRDEAKAYFDKKAEGKVYKSPLPKDQKVILPK